MFGDNHSHNASNTSGSAIIKSGYDVTSLAGDTELLKPTFQNALKIGSLKDATEKSIYQAAKDAGTMRGLGVMFKNYSREKLNVAKAALGLKNAAMAHQKQAANLELQWEQGTARHLQGMSETLLQLGITQENHTGFTTYCDTADKLLKGL
ncbi:hypothetical protein [Nostoc phage A1]|nr:hypothetical protein [Nostoc phage A1]